MENYKFRYRGISSASIDLIIVPGEKIAFEYDIEENDIGQRFHQNITVYSQSVNGHNFCDLMNVIRSNENIRLAYQI